MGDGRQAGTRAIPRTRRSFGEILRSAGAPKLSPWTTCPCALRRALGNARFQSPRARDGGLVCFFSTWPGGGLLASLCSFFPWPCGHLLVHVHGRFARAALSFSLDLGIAKLRSL